MRNACAFFLVMNDLVARQQRMGQQGWPILSIGIVALQ
jgi:hypothetical protein